jgi:hypothetical protein
MAQVGQKSETWKQKRGNMRASVSMRVRVRACACARAQPKYGDAARRGPRRGLERTPQPCVQRRQSRNPRPRPWRRPHRDRHGHPPRGTPITAGGEHRRARRCSPSGGGGRKRRQLAPRHALRPRSRATPSPPRPWRSREAQRVHIGGALAERAEHLPARTTRTRGNSCV